jgi:hypothetical protein
MATEKTGRVWVLDTETKGTGAEMVSLERLERERRSPASRERVSVVQRPPAAKPEGAAGVTEAAPAEAEGPRRFKLVNVIKNQVVTEDASAREIVSLLEEVRSAADVHIYVWQGDRWRPLSLSEKKAFWGFRSNGARRSWDGRGRDSHSEENGARSDGRNPHADRERRRQRPSATAAGHLPRVRPRLGRAPRSRPGGNR